MNLAAGVGVVMRWLRLGCGLADFLRIAVDSI